MPGDASATNAAAPTPAPPRNAAEGSGGEGAGGGADELPEHSPATYRGVGTFFVVAAIVAATFGYLGLQTQVGETDETGHPVGDALVEGASGAMTVTTGWIAMGIAVLCALVAIVCFLRAAR